MSIADELRKLREEYLTGNEETKRMLEKRFGKHAINQALEETYSAEWLEKYAKACPYCGTQIQVGREPLALKHFVSQLVVGEINILFLSW